MLRVIVSVLAAFVGFSFGHAIPKWMESRQKCGTGMQSPSLSEHSPRTRKQSMRKKSLRKFKFGLQKPGKDNVASLRKLCDDAEVTSHEGVQSNADDRLRKEHKKLKFGAMDKSNHGLDSSAKRPLCAPLKQNGCHDQQAAPTDPNRSRHGLSEVSSSQLNAAPIPPQDVQVLEALKNPVAYKSSSLQSSRGSPTKAKSQMKQWKMKLMSLRSKAMASEKIWYEKFDNEGCGAMLSVSSPTGGGSVMATKKTAKGKENESPHVLRTKKRDFFWSRSSSRVGLLVEAVVER